MKNSLLRGLALSASLLSLTAVSAQAQTRGTLTTRVAPPTADISIEKYRLETNDCLGCGAVDLQSRDDVVNYLQDMGATLSSNASPTVTSRTASRKVTDADTQIVFLDFDAGGDPTFPVCRDDGTLFGLFTDHVYSQAERDAIQARVENDYKAFNFEFTQVVPATGEFSTISIGANDAPLDCSQGSNVSIVNGGLSVLFGRADEIDFKNLNKSNTAFADASVWEFLAQFGGGFLFENFSNIDVANDFGGDFQAALDFAVLGQTANTGAHELGHTLGLRHQNSFGAPGDGLPNTGRISPFDFVPVFTGPSNAAETILHTMASGASVGLGFDGGVNSDRFLSERSAIRLTVNEIADDLDFLEGRNGNRFGLKQIYVPNTIEVGVNEDARLDAKARIIYGDIDTVGQIDSYNFWAREGQFLHAELVPGFATGLDFTQSIMGQIKIYEIMADESLVLIGESAQSFESLFDAEIFDVVAPKTGLYRLEVSAPDEVFFGDDDGDGDLDPFPITAAGAPELLTGAYQVLAFSSNILLNDFNRDELVGSNREDWRNRNRQGQ